MYYLQRLLETVAHQDGLISSLILFVRGTLSIYLIRRRMLALIILLDLFGDKVLLLVQVRLKGGRRHRKEALENRIVFLVHINAQRLVIGQS